MATTARGYPYPVLADAPNVPSHFQSLAAAIDTDVGTVATNLSTYAGGLACVLVNGVAQTIATGTSGIALGYDTELWDPSNLFTSGNPTRITTTGSGTQVWFATAHFELAGSATGIRDLYFRVNNVTSTEWFATRDLTASGSANSKLSSSALLIVTGGQYIEAIAMQNSGGSLNTSAGKSRFGAFRIA